MTDENPIFLYPRLSNSSAREILAGRSELSLESLRNLGGTSHQLAAPNPTGGTPVPTSRLEQIQSEVRGLSDEFGFPDDMSIASQAEFDRRLGTLLYGGMGIVVADAGHHEVWSFLSLVLLPEIPQWRFGAPNEERLLGSNRNTFERLWWRAWSLGPDLTFVEGGAQPFGEDEYVQIMERTTLAGNRRIALALQSHVWKAGTAALPVPRATYLRALVVRVRALRAHLDFDSMSDLQLHGLIDSSGDMSLRDIGARR